MGLASKVMNIRPWEWKNMTVEEEDYVCLWLEDYIKQQEDEAAKLKKGK